MAAASYAGGGKRAIKGHKERQSNSLHWPKICLIVLPSFTGCLVLFFEGMKGPLLALVASSITHQQEEESWYMYILLRLSLDWVCGQEKNSSLALFIRILRTSQLFAS